MIKKITALLILFGLLLGCSEKSLPSYESEMKANWEVIEVSKLGSGTSRMRTPGGWLVKSIFSHGVSLCYVPDSLHVWGE